VGVHNLNGPFPDSQPSELFPHRPQTGNDWQQARFYEQVTDVKFVLSFFLHRAFAYVIGLVAPHAALHRFSIRTLGELFSWKLGAGWGSRGESMLPFLSRT
jgi:hypothetical protein